MIADLLDHGRSVGFFTTVAAHLRARQPVRADRRNVARRRALWIAGIVLWASSPTPSYDPHGQADKPPLGEASTAAGCCRSSRRSRSRCSGRSSPPASSARQRHVLFFCLAMWLGGGMLYIWIISLIFYRYTFFPLRPSDLAPPYWINMGAVAISTLAGTLLVLAAPALAAARWLLPFLKGSR